MVGGKQFQCRHEAKTNAAFHNRLRLVHEGLRLGQIRQWIRRDPHHQFLNLHRGQHEISQGIIGFPVVGFQEQVFGFLEAGGG